MLEDLPYSLLVRYKCPENFELTGEWKHFSGNKFILQCSLGTRFLKENVWPICRGIKLSSLRRLKSVKRSYILKQTCIWKVQVCLIIHDLLVDTRLLRVCRHYFKKIHIVFNSYVEDKSKITFNDKKKSIWFKLFVACFRMHPDKLVFSLFTTSFDVPLVFLLFSLKTFIWLLNHSCHLSLSLLPENRKALVSKESNAWNRLSRVNNKKHPEILDGTVIIFAFRWNIYIFRRAKTSLVDPFVPRAPSLYPVKISENLTVFWCFQEVEKGCIVNEWVKWARAANFNNRLINITSLRMFIVVLNW